MDQQTGLSDVLEALQTIIASPNLVTSQHISNSSFTAQSSFPILPHNITTLPIPSIDNPMSANTPSTQNPENASSSLTNLADHLTTTILPNFNLSALSPNYYGFVTGGVTPAALLADLLAPIYDQNVQVHLPLDTISTTVESAALNLLVHLFHLPEQEWAIGRSSSSGGGTFTTGATASNVMGLALGREFVIRKALERKGIKDASCGDSGIAELMIEAGVAKIQILSTLPHSSIAKAASIVGIGRRNCLSIATPSNPLQIDITKLEHEAQRTDVLNILAISAGEVNTGHFATASAQQWNQLRRICDKYGIWTHVDGAFGLFGRLFDPANSSHDEFKEIAAGVEGLELADSITGDCHKLLNVPYDCGVFFTRHKTLLPEVFQNGNAAYLTGGTSTTTATASHRNEKEPNNELDAILSPLNIGIENSRRFRALPVYATLMTYGRSGYIDMLSRQIRLARRVTSWLVRRPEFEVLPSSSSPDSASLEEREKAILRKTFIIVLFRTRDEGQMQDFVKKVNETGKLYLSGTVWEGKKAARMAISHWAVDVGRDGKLVEDVLDEVVGGRQ